MTWSKQQRSRAGSQSTSPVAWCSMTWHGEWEQLLSNTKSEGQGASRLIPRPQLRGSVSGRSEQSVDEKKKHSLKTSQKWPCPKAASHGKIHILKQRIFLSHLRYKLMIWLSFAYFQTTAEKRGLKISLKPKGVEQRQSQFDILLYLRVTFDLWQSKNEICS